MKHAFMIHGWGGTPNEKPLVWLRQELEANGYNVTIPQMPDADWPRIETWVPKLSEIVRSPDRDTILIGHSIGCQTILRYLETLTDNASVGKVILVAPWLNLKEDSYEDEDDRKIADPWLKTPIDFDSVKRRATSFTVILSDDDYFVPVSDGNLFRDKLGATVRIEHGKQHFSEEDGVTELPEALEAVLD